MTRPPTRTDRLLSGGLDGLRLLARTFLMTLGLLIVVYAYLMNFDPVEAMDVLWRFTERYHWADVWTRDAVHRIALQLLLSVWAGLLALHLLERISRARRRHDTPIIPVGAAR